MRNIIAAGLHSQVAGLTDEQLATLASETLAARCGIAELILEATRRGGALLEFLDTMMQTIEGTRTARRNAAAAARLN